MPAPSDTQTSERAPAHSDIDQRGWWRHLPRATHPYLLLARFDRPIGWWLLLLPGWWVIPVAGSDTGAVLWLMGLFLVGAVSMRAAGCVVNDLWDRRLDRKVARTATRPLAAGTVSILQALIFLAMLCAAGLVILLQLPFEAVLTGITALPLVLLYPLAKRVTWWPQAVLGLTFSWGVPLGWVAVSAAMPPPELALVYAGSVAWVFGYDTIYAVQDMADDRMVGVKSSALGLGRHLRRGVFTAYAAAIILLAAGFLSIVGPGIWLAGLAGMGGHLMWQVRRIDLNDPAGALYLFKSNRDAGLLLTAGLLAQHLTG